MDSRLQASLSLNAFNELLHKLRAMHWEMCARNALLENQNLKEHQKPDNEHEDDPWLPRNFTALDDGPLPRCIPPSSSMRAPRASLPTTFHFRLTDTSAEQQDLHHSIGNLLRRQTDLMEQITDKLKLKPPEVNHSPSSLKTFRTKNAAEVSAASNDAAGKRVNRGSSASRASHASPLRQKTKTRSGSVLTIPGINRGMTSNITPCGGDEKVSFAVEVSSNSIKAMRAKHSGTVDFSSVNSISGFRMLVGAFLDSFAFSMLSSFLILSYAVLVAAETHIISQDPGAHSPFIQTSHYVYIGVWCFESLLHFIGEGCKETLFGRDGFWNRLDLMFIVSGLTEIALQNVGSIGAMASIVRAVRICRIIRTVRLVRTWNHVLEFQKMAYALMSCWKTLLCSLSLLSFVMFFFAVWFTQSAADLELREQTPDLELRYGDLWASTYTLFLTISNGISWDVCYIPLRSVSSSSAAGFIVYVFATLFGVLNVVTSVFVESVIRSVQHHKDLLIQDQEEEKRIAVQHIREIFAQVDVDGSGFIGEEEMGRFLRDPVSRKYLEALEINAEDTVLLFNLVDADGSGLVDLDEFCAGCLKLKGNAKAMDIHVLCFQMKLFLARWGDFTHFVQESFVQVRDSNSHT